MWNLVVPKLCFESAIFPNRREVALIAVEAALGLVSHIIASAEHVIQSDVATANVEVLPNITVLVQLRGSEIRFERKIGTPIYLAPECSDAEFNLAALNHCGFPRCFLCC